MLLESAASSVESIDPQFRLLVFGIDYRLTLSTDIIQKLSNDKYSENSKEIQNLVTLLFPGYQKTVEFVLVLRSYSRLENREVAKLTANYTSRLLN